MDSMIYALQHWFGIAQDSSQDVLIQEYIHDSHGIREVYNITQGYYASHNISTIHLYRCDSGISGQLVSWTRDIRLAHEYMAVRHGGTIIEADIAAHDILVDVELGELYYEDGWDEVLGMMPCDECIIINR